MNFLFDFYNHRISELKPLNFENVLAKRCTIFSFGEQDSRFIDNTFLTFFQCHYLGI